MFVESKADVSMKDTLFRSVHTMEIDHQNKMPSEWKPFWLRQNSHFLLMELD